MQSALAPTGTSSRAAFDRDCPLSQEKNAEHVDEVAASAPVDDEDEEDNAGVDAAVSAMPGRMLIVSYDYLLLFLFQKGDRAWSIT